MGALDQGQPSRVLDESLLVTVYQTVFRLGMDRLFPCGYVALARFPIAPRVPVALRFRIARAEGLGREMESLAAETAVGSCDQLPRDCFLTVNSSLMSVEVVLGELAPRVEVPVILDIHYGRSSMAPTRGSWGGDGAGLHPGPPGLSPYR